MALLVAPAIEVEVRQGKLAGRRAHECGPGVAAPQVLCLDGPQLNLGSEHVTSLLQLVGPGQYNDGFKAGDGLRDQGDFSAHRV